MQFIAKSNKFRIFSTATNPQQEEQQQLSNSQDHDYCVARGQKFVATTIANLWYLFSQNW